jgi:hypothetical protein
MSRFDSLGRHMGMTRRLTRAWFWLAAIVLAHLAISMAHGSAHAQAQVPLSPAQNLFVLAIIVAGPPVGLVLMWPAERVGGWVVAGTMAAALVFGVLNHFVFVSPDHVTHVVARWRTLFAVTASLLAATEALGSLLALRMALGRERKGP